MRQRNKRVKSITAMLVAAVMLIGSMPAAMAATYTGDEITPDIAAYSAGTQLTKGVDYDLSYENNVNVGTATAIIIFKGNYTGTRTVDFNIVARALSNDTISISEIGAQTYTGAEIKPEPMVTYGDVTLMKDKDYTLTYTGNVDVGLGNIVITFIGNYEGEASKSFEIVPDEVSTEDIVLSETEAQTYTGNAIMPEPSITYHGVILEKDKDYTLSHENNVNAGMATIHVTFIGNYAGRAETTFEIVAKVADESNITISTIPDQTYTGAAITPEPTVMDTTR